MVSRIEKYLQDVALLPGLAGFEGKVAAYMTAEFERLGLKVEEDTMGNIITKVEGTDPEAPVIMVFAHMDSLGFMVKYIEEDGFLRIERLGGIPEKVLPSTEVVVGCKNGTYLPGLIGCKSHHVTPAEEKYVVNKYGTLFVDIGAKSREEVFALGIDVGSPIVYKPKYQKLLNDRAYLSFSDNRSGCASLLELANTLQENPRPSTVYIVASVQEEYNLRGAMVASRTVKPDIAICIDGGTGHDTPDTEGSGHVMVGGGAAMWLYTFHGRGTLNGTISHPAMIRLFDEAAERMGHRMQRMASIGGLTDSSYVQLEGTGVKAIDVMFPGRYAHTPCELVDLNDLESVTKVIKEVVDNIDANTDFSRNCSYI